MQENRPRITVGIVTWNRCDYLVGAVESVMRQIEHVDELLVVNDGSSDGTKAYLDTLQAEKVTIINLPENAGRPAARSEAAKRFSGDYLLWLDDDDALSEDALLSCRRALTHFPDCQILYNNLLICDENLIPKRPLNYTAVDSERLVMQMLYENVIPNGGTLVHRSVFERIGYYNPDFTRCQDYEFWVRCALAGCRFAHNPDITYFVRYHDENSANPEIKKEERAHRLAITHYILENSAVEEIYSVLDWSQAPEKSMSEALFAISKILFDHGDAESALECVEQSIEYYTSQEAQLLRQAIVAT